MEKDELIILDTICSELKNLINKKSKELLTIREKRIVELRHCAMQITLYRDRLNNAYKIERNGQVYVSYPAVLKGLDKLRDEIKRIQKEE